MKTIIVTRHPALVEYLREVGIVEGKNVQVLSHVDSPELIRGKHVIGVLPLRLAALAATITEIPLELPAEMRGRELTLEQVRQFAGQPVEYVVNTFDRVVSAAKVADNVAGLEAGDIVMSLAK